MGDSDSNADIVATNVGHLRVAQATETFTHDWDGNLASDSLWTNTWNAENRRMVVESSAAVPAAGRAREQWMYLPDGRWIERIVSTNNGSGYFPAWTNRFVWDGNVLLAVLDSQSSILQSFARGLDLSGSHQGAGGVGGLLWVSAETNGTHFACFDGNGNVMALVNASTGAESARYEYGPFGEDIRATGRMARINSLRFSTQYADDVTGDRKYLYRDLDAPTGRWPNRDPLEEYAGPNIQSFSMNSPLLIIDVLGLGTWKINEDSIDLNRPGISPKAQEPEGFSVSYNPDKDECPKGTIVLYQIVGQKGFSGQSPHVDGGTDQYYRHRNTPCPLPPAMKPTKLGVPNSYVDSPAGAGLTWQLTAVAVCRSSCKELELLSTYYFEFDSRTRKIIKRDPTYKKHFRKGMDNYWDGDNSVDSHYPNGRFW